MHTNPTLPCVSSARKPQGMKSIPYLSEHWEPVFQVISVCRTKLNSPAAQVGGRAALAPGRSCRAPGAPALTEGGWWHSQPQEENLHSRQGQSKCHFPRDLTLKTSETAALLTLHDLTVRETEIWGAASEVPGSRDGSLIL